MKKIDDSGYWVIKANPISRVGVFDYLGRQIDVDKSLGLDPNRIYKVFRPAGELFSTEALESFAGIPFIDEHEMLGEGFTPVEKRPSHGTIMNVRPSMDLPDTLIADIKIYTRTMKDKIESGKKGLSLGYYCKYVPEMGVYKGQTYDFVQTNLRGNHIALVDRPRNDVYVCDCAIVDVVTFDSLPEEITEMKNKEKAKMLQEKLTALLTANDAEACEACLDFLDGYLAKREAAGKGQPSTDGDAPKDLPEPPVDDDKGDGEGEPKGDGDADKGGEPPADEAKGEGAEKADEPKEPVKSAEPVPPADAPKDDPADKSEEKPVEDCGDKGKKKGASMDEAVARKEYFKEFARAHELAERISGLTGAFDSAEMTEQDVAVYGCQKLGIAFDEANPASAIFAVKAALQYAQKAQPKAVTLDTGADVVKPSTEAAQTSKCFEEYFK